MIPFKALISFAVTFRFLNKWERRKRNTLGEVWVRCHTQVIGTLLRLCYRLGHYLSPVAPEEGWSTEETLTLKNEDFHNHHYSS